jgi:predicted lipoprotein with Yx(FWY)xxD motif
MAQRGLQVAGAALLVATAGIHLDLYLTGYRSIPVIGWLFLLQVIVAFGLGAVVLVTGSRLAAAAGAGFALATLGGYLLSIWVGLFGFREVRTTSGIVAGAIEIAAFAVLALLALAPDLRPAPRPGSAVLARLQAVLPRTGLPQVALAVTAVSVVALALLGIAAAQAGTSAPAATASAGGLRTERIGGVTVLANAKGFTLYSFAPDTATTSKCYGACAAYWPPVTGTVSSVPGVTGHFGAIARTGGGSQVTFDGHPLYTYIGDSAPAQASGNNLNLNGGIWHEVVVPR